VTRVVGERVLVTGAAGFVGGHLLAALAEDPAAPLVVAWRRPGGRLPAAAKAATWREVDLLDRTAVEQAVAEAAPTQVYHCGGAAAVAGSWGRVVETLETNVIGTDNLLQALHRTHPTVRVLVPGSALVYRPCDESLTEDHPVGPVTPYGLSKLAQEMLAQQLAGDGLPVLLTRSFTHLGPGQDRAYAASSFAHQIARIEAGAAERVLRVGALDARRDLMDVRDTVRAYRVLLATGVPGRLYNVCTGRAHRMQDVVDRLRRLARTPISVEVDPERLRPSDHPLLRGDPGRIGAETGWAPRIPLDETLRDLLDHWRGAVAAGNDRPAG